MSFSWIKVRYDLNNRVNIFHNKIIFWNRIIAILIHRQVHIESGNNASIEAEWRIYASVNWAIIGLDNGLSPGRRQAIIWTNDGILLIGPLGTNFSEILIEIYIFSFKKMHLKISSGNWQPFCLGLNVLKKNIHTYKTRGYSGIPNGYSIVFNVVLHLYWK